MTQKKLEELAALLEEYALTLDDKRKDEWYTTERGNWDSACEEFLLWCKSKMKKPPAKRPLETK